MSSPSVRLEEEEEEGEQTSDLVQENGAGKPSVESFNVIVDPFDQDDISKSHVGEMSVRMSSGISSVVAREGTFQFLSPRSSINTAIDLEEAYNHLKDGTMIVQMENADIIKNEDEKRGSKKTPESPKGGPEFPPWVINPYFATLKQPNAFWVDSLILILMGGLIGLVNLGYKYAITSAPRAYLTIGDDNDYPNSKATVGFATGRLWWIGLGAATGFINAVAKIILKLGNHVGFMGAIQMQKSDPVESLKVVICTIISLVGGSSIGPEAGLAAIGGGIASFLYTRVLRFRYDEDRRYKYYVLAGMSAGFTGFLPSPILAVMMTWELGIPPAFWELNQLHALTLFTMAAVPAAAVFFALEETTLYDPLNIQIPNADDYNPSKYAFAFGILFGIMGALLAIVYHMICNLVRFAFLYPKKYASKYCGPKIGSIAINTLGGVLYGTLGYVMPLTMGDGAFQIQGIIANSEQIGSSILAASCFTNILTFWICMESGFVGGIFTPMLATGNLLGGVFANITGVVPSVAVGCSFISLAAAVIPAPLFLVFFSSSLFQLGARGIIPITTCAFTSQLLIGGIGLLPLLSNNWASVLTSKNKARFRWAKKSGTA